MIISHKHKFIFVKTAKTAGTSIEIALSKICGEDDVITPLAPKFEKIRKDLGIRGAQNYSVPINRMKIRDVLSLIKNFRLPRFYAHTDARRIKKYMSHSQWNEYFKFCFVRNPWDRYLSNYYWSGGDEKFGNLSNYIASKRSNELLSTELYCENGKIVMDRIFKYEELESSIQELNKILDLKGENQLSMEHIYVNTSKRPEKKSITDSLKKEEVNFIADLYADEIEWFNYSLAD